MLPGIDTDPVPVAVIFWSVAEDVPALPVIAVPALIVIFCSVAVDELPEYA